MSLIQDRLPSPGRAAPGSTGIRLASALPWLCLLTITLLVNALLGLASGPTAVTIALLGVAHSALGFHRHGGTRVTPPGVFLFGMLIFGYFPTLYYAWLDQQFVPVPWEVRGLAGVLALQFIVYAVWAAPDRSVPETERLPAPASAWVPGMLLGATSLSVGVAIGALKISTVDTAVLQPLSQPAGYAGIVLIALSLVQAHGRVSPSVLVVIGSLFAIFVTLLFTGGGRLVLGSLALALTMSIGFRWRPSFVKPAILATLPPGLTVLARMRAKNTADLFTGYQESGLESVVWPQRLFFRLLEDSALGQHELALGESFFAAAVSWVPRELWADKPVGLGAALTAEYRPELLAVGHSEAALVQGEFVYNFGLWGLVLAFIALGVGVYYLDAWITTLHTMRVSSTSTLITQALGVVLTAGLVDLVWVGTFTYVARAGFACVVLLFLWIVAKTLNLDARQTVPDARTQRSATATVPGITAAPSRQSRVGGREVSGPGLLQAHTGGPQVRDGTQARPDQ